MSEIDIIALGKLSQAFDAFVSECTDAEGKPKAPSIGALAKARGYLPPYCINAYPAKARTAPAPESADCLPATPGR